MSIMTDWSDSESVKLLHLHIALNCYCMCVTSAGVLHYHWLHDAIVGLTNGKCTATPMCVCLVKCVTVQTITPAGVWTSVTLSR